MTNHQLGPWTDTNEVNFHNNFKANHYLPWSQQSWLQKHFVTHSLSLPKQTNFKCPIVMHTEFQLLGTNGRLLVKETCRYKQRLLSRVDDISMLLHVHAHANTHTHTQIHTCTHTHTHTNAHTYTHTHAYTHTHIRICFWSISYCHYFPTTRCKMEIKEQVPPHLKKKDLTSAGHCPMQ